MFNLSIQKHLQQILISIQKDLIEKNMTFKTRDDEWGGAQTRCKVSNPLSKVYTPLKMCENGVT